MKFLVVLLFGAVSALGAVESLSGSFSSPEPGRTILDFGVNLHQFDYKEHVMLPLKSTESAFLPTFVVGVTYRPLGGTFRYRGQFELGLITSLYDGSTHDGVPVIGPTKNRFIAFEFFPYFPVASLSETTELELYSGLRMENWSRDLGYEEVYNWFTLPLGVIVKMNLGRYFAIAGDASVRLQFGGTTKVMHSQISPQRMDDSVALGATVGARVALPISYYPPNSNISVSLTPWYEKRSFGESELKPIRTSSGGLIFEGNDMYRVFMEPASDTNLFGVLSSVSYKF